MKGSNPRFVNPFTDMGFKIIFGRPASKPLLIVLLNELLQGEHHIEDLTFIDKEDHSDNVASRGIIYDIYCRTSAGEYIIVEMQNRWHSNFLDRALYYVCRAVGRSLDAPPPEEIRVPMPTSTLHTENSEGYAREDLSSNGYGAKYRLSTVYGIFLMNFKENGLDPKFRTDVAPSDMETGRVVNPHLRQIYLQFPFFTKELEECTTLYDKLIYTLKNMETWDRMPEALREQVFAHLDSLAAVANLSEADQIAYDRALDNYRIGRIVEEDAWEKGRAEGHEKGLEEGLMKGRETGIAEGQTKERIRTARNLKFLGVDVYTIAKATGLTAREIEEL